jgi:hypothetical protein
MGGGGVARQLVVLAGTSIASVQWESLSSAGCRRRRRAHIVPALQSAASAWIGGRRSARARGGPPSNPRRWVGGFMTPMTHQHTSRARRRAPPSWFGWSEEETVALSCYACGLQPPVHTSD